MVERRRRSLPNRVVDSGAAIPEDGAVAIAVVPEPPRGRWERVGSVVLVVVALAVLALFVYSMLDAYVF
jgi:hypothetical protein